MTERKERQTSPAPEHAREDFQSTYARETAARLIDQIRKGTSPYQQAWENEAPSALPYNPSTRTRYQGINAMRLLLEHRKDPRWLTLRQVNLLGGRVKKGEKGVRCIYFARREVDAAENARLRGDPEGVTSARKRGAKETVLIPCPFTVFNVEQTEDLKILPEALRGEAKWEPMKRAEDLIRNSHANIRHTEGAGASYNPRTDMIELPARSQFPDSGAYYDTLLHELGHWTGHRSRLNRLTPEAQTFGSPEYAREELRAETASLMISTEIGLPHRLDSHAAYIKSWIEILENDPRELFRACSDAQRITDYVLHFDQERIWIVNFDRRSVCCTNRAEALAKGADYINEHRLCIGRFRDEVLHNRKDGNPEAIYKSEWETARNLLSPLRNPMPLARGGLCGIELTTSPMEFLLAARAVSPALGKSAERVVIRALGEAEAKAVFRLSEESEQLKTEEDMRLKLEAHFAEAERAGENLRAKLLRAPAPQREAIFRRAADLALTRLGLSAEREAEVQAKQPDAQDFGRGRARGRTGPEMER